MGMIYLLTPIVIQSEAKNLEGIHVNVLVYATEILPPFGRLNDKQCQEVYRFLFYFANQLKNTIFAPNEAEKIHSLDVNGSQHGDVDGIGLAPSPSSGDSLLATRCGGLRMCFPL